MYVSLKCFCNLCSLVRMISGFLCGSWYNKWCSSFINKNWINLINDTVIETPYDKIFDTVRCSKGGNQNLKSILQEIYKGKITFRGKIVSQIIKTKLTISDICYITWVIFLSLLTCHILCQQMYHVLDGNKWIDLKWFAY